MSFLSVCSMAGMRTLEKMFVYFPVIYLLVVAASSTPILVSECGTLDVPFANYQLSQDISISSNEELVCFDIRSNGITLDGNGFGISSVSEQLIPATGVKFSGSSVTVKNLKISNLRTGVHANGKYGKVEYNTITQAVNGIDVTETHNDISYNTIKNFDAAESAAGIYVYFPAISPVASFINITNNVISDIRGDSFVQGISVYYATSVNIANNRIFNLAGDLKTESISLIQSEAENTDNVFISPSSGGSAFVLSCILVVASALWFFSPAAITSSPLPTPIPIPFPTSALDQAKEEEKEKKEKEEENKEKEKESEDDMEMDGADVRVRKSKLSFSVGSSPPVKSPSL